jgi:hypothetical protein
MSSLSLRRKTLLLLLCAVLAAPWASAAPQRSHAPQAVSPAPLDLLGLSWSFLKSLWSEEGCHIDPDGRCIAGTAQVPQPKSFWSAEGCGIDPDGRRITGTTQTPQPKADTGCGIDPSGRCHG